MAAARVQLVFDDAFGVTKPAQQAALGSPHAGNASGAERRHEAHTRRCALVLVADESESKLEAKGFACVEEIN